MNIIEEGFLRLCLKPAVKCGIPGRLRLSFSKYELLPKGALAYLHYIEDVFMMLNGINEVQLNPRIGTILVLYDPAKMTQNEILYWVDTVVNTGIDIAKKLDPSEPFDEKALFARLHRRLLPQLPAGSGKEE